MAVSKSQANLISALGGTVLDYVEITSPVNITATSEGTADTVITGNPVVYDGSTTILITFSCPYVTAPVSAAKDHQTVLYDGSSPIGGMILASTISSASNQRVSYYQSRRITPSAGSHTYSIRSYLGSAGTAVIGAGTGASGGNVEPAYMRITRESSVIGSSGIANIQGGFAPLDSNLQVPFANLPAKVPTQVSRNVNTATPIVLTWEQTPVNKMFIVTASTATTRAISSITQTNVTWSSLKTVAGTDVRVEVWKGIPSGGTISTTSSIAYAAGATNFDAAGLEWPDTKVTGTLDSAADNSGASGANANVALNDIIPTQNYALILCAFCVANGTITLQLAGNVNRFGPQTPNFGVFGWAAPGAKIPMYAGVPVQTSSAWCNTLVSII